MHHVTRCVKFIQLISTQPPATTRSPLPCGTTPHFKNPRVKQLNKLKCHVHIKLNNHKLPANVPVWHNLRLTTANTQAYRLTATNKRGILPSPLYFSQERCKGDCFASTKLLCRFLHATGQMSGASSHLKSAQGAAAKALNRREVEEEWLVEKNSKNMRCRLNACGIEGK